MNRAALVVLVAAVAGVSMPAQADPTVTIPPPAEPAQTVTPPDQGAAAQTQTQAAPAPGADPSDRFTFHRVGDAFVRLDTRTGDVAQCDGTVGTLSCKLAPDQRAALDSEIARLQRENAALKKSLLSHGLELPADVTAEAKAPQAPRADAPVPPADVPDVTPRPPKAPSEPDLDRAIAYMKHVWRRLVDMMLDLQRDVQRRS